MTLIATPGAANANVFCTLAESDEIMSEELYNEDWLNAGTSEKERAKIAFTRLLNDRVSWYGSVSSTDQALQWPRIGVYDRNGAAYTSDEIPDWLKRAETIGAKYLLQQDRSAAQDGAPFTSVSIPGLSFTQSGSGGGGMDPIPAEVASMVKFWARSVSGSGQVKLVRT